MPHALRPGPAPAVTALVRDGVDFTLHPYDLDEFDDGAEIAELLDVEADRVLDTLIVDAGGRLAVCIVPAGWELDAEAAARTLGAPGIRPALDAIAERATGHVAEAMSPLGHRRRLPTVIDQGVLALAAEVPGITVFVASGQLGLEVEVALDDLVRLTAATGAEITAEG